MIFLENVLVVDDEQDICDFFKYFLKRMNFTVDQASDLESARSKLIDTKFDLIILDLKLPDGNGLEFLEEVKLNRPETKVMIITGVSTIGTAVEAIKKGAFDYIEKPFDDLDELKKIINRAADTEEAHFSETQYSTTLRENIGFVVGSNDKMKSILSVAQTVADKDITILISGETGTGKEILAQYIHGFSSRAHNPFVPVNCGGFTETLLESQLFGHEKGAFTDAVSRKKGVFELAEDGTLFLDEIGESSKNVQVKLLRVLDTGKFNRIGSETYLNTSCRIIAATNVNLEHAVEQGGFRKDLYYRLNVVHLEMPPLRERYEDIPQLAEHIVSNKLNCQVHFTPASINKLTSYSWPGNIRELSNVLSRAVAFAKDRVIEEKHLDIEPTKNYRPLGYVKQNEYNNKTKKDGAVVEDLEHKVKQWFDEYYDIEKGLDVNKIKQQIEKAETTLLKHIVNLALKETYGNRKKASEMLGISTRTLRYILNEKQD